MEEHILPEVPEFKLYKKVTINVSTFLAGPLVAGYMIAENFKQLGDPSKAKVSWIITIVFNLAFFCAIVFIPELEKIPNILFPVFYMSITSFLVQHFQAAKISLHQANGGQFFSAGRAIVAGLICIAITFLVIMGLMLATNQIEF